METLLDWISTCIMDIGYWIIKYLDVENSDYLGWKLYWIINYFDADICDYLGWNLTWIKIILDRQLF